MSPQEIISLKDICVSFVPENPVLKNLNLSLREGEYLSILGPGGSGKSTLLKVMLGIVKPSEGDIFLFGKQLAKLTQKDRMSYLNKIGMAFQQGALFDFMTVAENIRFAMDNMTTFSKQEKEERIRSFLKQVNLPDAADKLPQELSGGMRRRVGIVRAMVINPALALLDEPTAGLDPVTTSIVIDMIHRIGRLVGSTLVCVTSSVEVAFRFAPRVAILNEGHIVAIGTYQELLQKNNPWIHNFLTLRSAA